MVTKIGFIVLIGLIGLSLGLQFEKRPPEEQKFIRAVPSNLESAYADLRNTVFHNQGLNGQWLYRVDQAIGNPERTDPRPDPHCDLEKLPAEQGQNCGSAVSVAEALEYATHQAVMGFIAEAAMSRETWDPSRNKYTGFAPSGDDHMDKQIRHILAIHCEKPDDPFFTEGRMGKLFHMPQHLDNMAVGLAPNYQEQILNHIESGEHDGRKIHPRGVHPDCKLSKGD